MMDSDIVDKSSNSETGDSTMDSSPMNNNSINIEEVKKVHSVNSVSSEDHGMDVDGAGDDPTNDKHSEKKNGILGEGDKKENQSNVEINDENSSPNHKQNNDDEKDSSKVSAEESASEGTELNCKTDNDETIERNIETNTDKTESLSKESDNDTSCRNVSDKSLMDVDIPSDKDTSINNLTSTAGPAKDESAEDARPVNDSSVVSPSKSATEECSLKTDSSDKDTKEKSTSEVSHNETVTKDAKDKESEETCKEAKDTPVVKDSTNSPAPAEGKSGKKKKSKTCEECGVKKGLKFQVLFKGKTRFLCSDTCFKNFKTKQMQQKASEAPSAPAKEPPAMEKATCFQCQKDIPPDQGFYPIVGEIKPLCSEECIKKHNTDNSTAKSCSQCKKVLDKPQDTDVLTWETMVFCNEDCLGKFQSYLGSHCTCCQSPVPQASLGKYSVCFGADIRQFCSCNCLDEFKKNLKVCSFCQTDLSAGVDSFLAPVGDKGQFKDFCSQNCMERYEVMNNISKSTPQSQMCTHCKKQGTFKIQVKLENESYALCSDLCVAGFRCNRRIKDKMCDTCYNFFNMAPEKEFSFKFDGSSKHFCTKACMTLFVLSHRKIVACVSCKVKKYNFDMIEKVDANGQTQIFCSLNCLSLYRVSVNAVSAKNVRCDHCGKNQPAQYHLTMSDGSVRNFCTYNCVIVFQNQYTNVCTLTTTAASRQTTVATSTIKTTAATNTPVISQVVSLAPATPRAQALPQLMRSLVPPPKIVQPRPALQPVAIIGSKPAAATMTSQSPLSNVTNSVGQQVIREVIVKPPAPKSQKNKSVSCKPIMLNKGINVKPTPCHKAVQTEYMYSSTGEGAPFGQSHDGQTPFFVPVPVPVYIPTPLIMFSRPVPCPVPFPVPIPVPIILPPKESSSQANTSTKVSEKAVSEKASQENCSSKNDVPKEGSKSQKENDESEEPADELSSSSSDECNDVNDVEDDEYAFKDGKSSHGKRSHHGSQHKGKSRKRSRMDDIVVEEAKANIIPQPEENHNVVQNDQPKAAPQLKQTFGVNAWKQWVLQKNEQMAKGSHAARKFKLFKTDLLQLPPDELNYSLSLFVKEVRKPTGEEYSPASIFYLCLGIQKYLFENGRLDNIFAEPHYEKFTECLHEILLTQDVPTADGTPNLKIEEEVLWESKQLGAHSPYALLNTLMYFNTKYFKLKHVEDHARLSFTHVNMVWLDKSATDPEKIGYLRYYPIDPLRGAGGTHTVPYYEQKENLEDDMRCPVKLYEFYLSKIPECCKGRNDIFYLTPDRSCSPETPVWYSSQPLSQDAISKMMQRITISREIP